MIELKDTRAEEVAALLTMDPIERYARQDRKPLNLFVQLLLVIFTTIVAMNVSDSYNLYERA